jgi:hypothetical protein
MVYQVADCLHSFPAFMSGDGMYGGDGKTFDRLLPVSMDGSKKGCLGMEVQAISGYNEVRYAAIK